MAETNIKDVKIKIGTETQFQEKLKGLPIGTLVGTTDPIQEGELDTSIITKLNKADNALPKPTNDTTGSENDVLSKTPNGSEWKSIKVLPTTSPSVGDVLGCISEGEPAWVSGALFEIYNHYMSFDTASGEHITLTKISTSNSGFVNLAEAYSSEIAHLEALGVPDSLIPVVGSIESNSQKFSAIAITGSVGTLYGESAAEIDISDLTNWSDNPLKV